MSALSESVFFHSNEIAFFMAIRVFSTPPKITMDLNLLWRRMVESPSPRVCRVSQAWWWSPALSCLATVLISSFCYSEVWLTYLKYSNNNIWQWRIFFIRVDLSVTCCPSLRGCTAHSTYFSHTLMSKIGVIGWIDGKCDELTSSIVWEVAVTLPGPDFELVRGVSSNPLHQSLHTCCYMFYILLNLPCAYVCFSDSQKH